VWSKTSTDYLFWTTLEDDTVVASSTVFFLSAVDQRMRRTSVDVRLPETLGRRLDVAVEVTEQTRTEVVIEALGQYLPDMESDEQFREGVVDLFLAGEIEYEALAEVIGRQDAEAVRASKDVLDGGEEFADRLAEL